jgi:raffinose/stachyose/melibiose transport system substrate-binding protein
MKKTVLATLALLLAFALVACTTPATPTPTTAAPTADPNAPVTIIVANGKGELTAQYAEAADEFHKAYSNITVQQYTGAVGDPVSILDKMIASGITVSLIMLEPGSIDTKYKDIKKVDLAGEPWMAQTDLAWKDVDGKVVGFPFAVEGFGIVYNVAVVEKATGGAFDPFSINTRDKFVALLDKVQADGIEFPIAYQTEGWSVSNHYDSMFLNQAADPNTIVAQLKAGTFDLANNATWNGYLDTMDLLKSVKYNKYGAQPLGSYYNDAHTSVGSGTSAFLFNGNWAVGSFNAPEGAKFGFIPVPVDNDPANPLNNKIAAGPTQTYVVNADATPAQIAAAKTYLNWLVDSDYGQKWLVNTCKVISAFKNNPNKISDPLGAAIMDAIAKGKTMPFSTNYVNASDWYNILGAEVQKYIDGKSTRAELAKAITDYYKSAT